jgi:hypothetical protein
VLPAPLHAVSFFESAGNAHYNSLVVADADGKIVGHYRKSHIPDGPGCESSRALYTNRDGMAALTRSFCNDSGGLQPTTHAALVKCLCSWMPADQEKWYFNPGDTGFKVVKTRYASIGCLICWDQVKGLMADCRACPSWQGERFICGPSPTTLHLRSFRATIAFNTGDACVREALPAKLNAYACRCFCALAVVP